MAPPELGRAVLAVSTVFCGLAFVSVMLRLWAARTRSRLDQSSILIFFAMAFGLLQLGSVYYEVLQAGLGQHVHHLTPSQVQLLLKGLTAQNIAWIFATNTVKLSVLIFYLNIFGIRTVFRRFTYGFVGFVLVYGVSSLLCVFTICRPFKATWDPSGPDAHCGNVMNAMLATAIINTFEDLVVVVMPLPIIWNLQMSRQKKLGVSAIVGAGLLICLINIARLGLAGGLDSSDTSYTYAYQNLCMNLEVQIGIVSACLPTVKSLFTKRSPIAHGTPPLYTGPNGQAASVTVGFDRFERFSRHSDDKVLLATHDEKPLDAAQSDSGCS